MTFLQDAVKLIGSINFPNMFLMTPKIDFGCILNDTVESKTIRVHNNTPLNVCYKFLWKKCCIKKITMVRMHLHDLFCIRPK